MKRMIYSILFVTVFTLSFSACTEEEVKPQETELNGGGTTLPGNI